MEFDRAPHDRVVDPQRIRHVARGLLPQAGGVLDVGEQKGDRAPRELARHARTVTQRRDSWRWHDMLDDHSTAALAFGRVQRRVGSDRRSGKMTRCSHLAARSGQLQMIIATGAGQRSWPSSTRRTVNCLHVRRPRGRSHLGPLTGILKTAMLDREPPEQQSRVSDELGWVRGDAPRKIWGLSHTHLANAIDELSTDSAEGAHESLLREATAAWKGFAWLAELGERLEVTEPLATACDDFVRGVAEGDPERTMRGYSAAETIVSRLREQFGENLGRSWNVQEIDEEFDRVIRASAMLVDRLEHEDLTDADIANTYELAVKIARGWTRLVHGSYFLAYSEPYSQAAARIVSGMKDHGLEQVRAGIEEMVALAARLSQPSAAVVDGERPRKGERVEFPEGVPGGRYVATTDGRPVEGFPQRWSVDVRLTDPREG